MNKEQIKALSDEERRLRHLYLMAARHGTDAELRAAFDEWRATYNRLHSIHLPH